MFKRIPSYIIAVKGFSESLKVQFEKGVISGRWAFIKSKVQVEI